LFSASDPCKQKDGVPRFMSIERERERGLKKLLWSKNGESFPVREAKKTPKAVGRRRGGPMPVASLENRAPKFFSI